MTRCTLCTRSFHALKMRQMQIRPFYQGRNAKQAICSRPQKSLDIPAPQGTIGLLQPFDTK